MTTLDDGNEYYVSSCLRFLASLVKTNPEHVDLMEETEIDFKLMDKWVEMLKANKHTPLSLGSGMWGIAELQLLSHRSTPSFLDTFYSCSLSLIPQCSAKNLSDVLFAIGRISDNLWRIRRYPPPNDWWHAYWERFEVVKGHFDDYEVTQMFYALNQLRNGISAESFKLVPFSSVIEEYRSRIPTMSSYALKMAILHMGKLLLKDVKSLEESCLRADELSTEDCMKPLSAISLAIGFSNLGRPIPPKLREYIKRNVDWFSIGHLNLISLMKVCLIQSCVLEQSFGEEMVLSVFEGMSSSFSFKQSELIVLQQALTWFGAASFPEGFADFIAEKREVLKEVLQGNANYGLKGLTDLNTLVAGILEKYGHCTIKSRKVVPEAACVITLEIEDQKVGKKLAILLDYCLGYNYWNSEGQYTKELTTKARMKSKLLEKLGYTVLRIPWDYGFLEPEVTKKHLAEFLGQYLEPRAS